jgi:hypothetical protein
VSQRTNRAPSNVHRDVTWLGLLSSHSARKGEPEMAKKGKGKGKGKDKKEKKQKAKKEE